MPRDARLEASDYFTGDFNRQTKLNYNELFRVPAEQVGKETPWNLGHFTSNDFVNRIRSRERILNPLKGFVDPDNPQRSELFVGMGRFEPDNPDRGYNFEEGRPIVGSPFRESPEFDQLWQEKFLLSPVRSPKDDLIKTMPSASDPDPQNFLAMRAEERAKQDAGEEPTSLEISKSKKFTKQEDEKAGEKVQQDEAIAT